MTITATAQQIVDAVHEELGLTTSVIGSSQVGQTTTQALALLNRLGDECVRVHDWQFLEGTQSFSGNGVDSAFDLPADFGRIVNQTSWAENMKRPMQGPLTSQQWGWTQFGIVSVGVYFRYRILGNQFVIFPTPGAGEDFDFFYIKKNWVIDADDQTMKDKITKAGDIPVFDRNLMIAGTKIKLWAIKGFDTTVLTTEFNYALQAEIGQNQGAPIIDLSGAWGFHLLDINNIPDGSWEV